MLDWGSVNRNSLRRSFCEGNGWIINQDRWLGCRGSVIGSYLLLQTFTGQAISLNKSAVSASSHKGQRSDTWSHSATSQLSLLYRLKECFLYDIYIQHRSKVSCPRHFLQRSLSCSESYCRQHLTKIESIYICIYIYFPKVKKSLNKFINS